MISDFHLIYTKKYSFWIDYYVVTSMIMGCFISDSTCFLEI